MQLLDSGGNPVSRSNVHVYATVASGPGSPDSAIASTDSSGLASYSGLAIYGDPGTYTLAFDSPGLDSVTADVTIAKASQTITFGGIAPRSASLLLRLLARAAPATTIGFGSPQQQLTATTTAIGLTVNFVRDDTGTTNDACTVSSEGVVTVLAVGTCSVTAVQGGDARYNPAPPVTTAYSIVPVVPGTPYITSVAPGDGAVTVGFTQPSFDGGAAITSYTATSSPGGITGSI